MFTPRSNKYIEFSTTSIRFILPWHAPTIIHAIERNKIDAEQLLFTSNQDKQQLTHDLFLLATCDCMTKNSKEASPLAIIARKLLN